MPTFAAQLEQYHARHRHLGPRDVEALKQQESIRRTNAEYGRRFRAYVRGTKRAQQASVGGPLAPTARLADRFLTDLGSAAYHAPGAAIVTGKAGYHDIGRAAHGDVSFRDTRALARAIAQSTYQDVRHPLRHPGFTALDLFAIASAGAGSAARLSAASRALEEGGARAALTRAASEGGSLLHRPAPGEIDLPGGVQALEHDNPLLNRYKRARMQRVARAAQEGRDVSPLLPRRLGKETSAQSVIGRELRAREQVLADFANAAPAALRHRLSQLSPAEHTAMRIRAIEGFRATRNPSEVITRQVAKHNDYAARAERRAAELEQRVADHPRLASRLAQLHADAVLNREIAKDIEAARPHLENPSRYFRETVVAARRESRRQQQQLVASERLSAEGARTRLGRMAEVYGGGKRVPRPRTEDEARARLAALDKQIEAFDAQAAKLTGHAYAETDIARAEQLRRNRINGLIDLFEREGKRKSGTSAALRAGRQRSVASELHSHVADVLDQIVAHRPHDPGVKAYLAAVKEREALVSALHGSLPGEGVAADLGSVIETHAPAGAFYFPTGERFKFPTRTVTGGPISRRPSATGLREPQPGRYLQGTLRQFTGKGVARGVVQRPGEAIASRAGGLNRLASAERLHDALMQFASPRRRTPYDIPIAKTLSPRLRREVAALAEEVASGDATALVRAEKRLEQILAPEAGQAVRYVDSRYLKEFASSARGLKAMAAFNKPFRFGGVYFRPAYLVTNRPQNFIMRHLAQGIVTRRPIRGTVKQIETELGPEASAGLHALGGTTRTESFLPKGRAGAVERDVTDWIQHRTDASERFLAVLARAHQKGYRTVEDLRRLGTQTAHDSRQLVNDRVAIARRARKDMVDFSVTPGERTLSDFVYFYPWLSRGSAWAARFVAEHPAKADALQQGGREADRQGIGDLGAVPAWLHGQINTRFGLVNPNPLNTFATPAEIVDAVKNPAAARSLGSEFGTPAIQALTTEPAQIPRRVVASLAPLSFAQRLGVLGHPSKTFPDTGWYPAVSRFVAGGLAPQQPDWAELRKQAYAEMPRPEAFDHKMLDLRQSFAQEIKRRGEKMPPELGRQLRLHEQRYGAYKRAGIKSGQADYQQRALAVDLKLLQQMGEASASQVRAWKRWAAKASSDDISKERRKIGERFFPTDWLNRAAKELDTRVPY